MGADRPDAPTIAQLRCAFGHPVRQRVLAEYARGSTSPSRVAARLDERLNVVAYHTRVLREAACIRLERVEQRRGAAEHFYRAAFPAVVEDDQWEALPLSLRRELIGGTLRLIGDDARRGAYAGGFDDDKAHLSRMPLALDQAGRAEVAGVLRRVTDEVLAIQAASDRRAGQASPFELAIMFFAAASAP